MITTKQKAAIELLLLHNEEEVVQILGIKKATLMHWLSNTAFVKELRSAETKQRRETARMAGRVVSNAANTLNKEIDLKTALEVLKIAGVLQPGETADPLADALMDLGEIK